MINTGFSEINEDRLNYEGNGFWYCEIAVTGACNFNCTYCNRFNAELDYDKTCRFVDQYKHTLKHIQITGGEPTLYLKLLWLLKFIRDRGIKIGLSTNGSADYNFYDYLGVKMFSISLDDYDTDILEKRGYREINKVISNIKKLSKKYYVNVGLVIDSLNCGRVDKIIEYILGLGVTDIKLSVSTKDSTKPVFNRARDYSRYPILNYRVKRFLEGKPMRGIPEGENFKCSLVRNDISIVGNKHFPCLVYAREKGQAIGELSDNVYADRLKWYEQHDPSQDPICNKYCMDFKCEFNRSKSAIIK